MKLNTYATRDLMLDSIDLLDTQFGKGFHKNHPELVVQLMALDSVKYAGQNIATAIQELANDISRIQPADMNGLCDIYVSLNKIATAIENHAD
jgi:hypothetical protein